MNMASWNIRGFNDPCKQRDLRSLIFKNKLCLVGLNETKVREENCSKIANDFLQGWRVRFNYNQHPNGRIWVLWNPEVIDACCIEKSEQVIHMKVTVIQKQISFFVSFVYGLHSRREQSELWKKLQDFAAVIGNMPWIVLGDFNVVRHPEERVGGNLHWSEASEDLQKCCMDLHLEDLRYSGHYFT